mmetsp:Transcript_30854/g.35181  ORF Transcript_30854/g.35181 Transcript_30854/m.35181 type:complete len:222 (-) Transcript_30854:154-819(-)|eukprot:CAMPEP_0194147682 /NCGR_PEP_ID=MMETSP0152-20130528/26874_1 /TAXON_ID=1049557 /ORGANISM="Thalassiothrix antarctica, Strain L6-D1" /LENGTH=221 /DNA_ID=CAMNT_0038848673 /DNA_START=33 /DNA_END=698 /DNA_ORIENTATION=+
MMQMIQPVVRNTKLLLHHSIKRNDHRFLSSITPPNWSTLESKAETIMENLRTKGETVGVAETTSGGLISAALWSSPIGSQAFKGAGIRLAYGINRDADQKGIEEAREFASTPMASATWGLVYEDGEEHSETGSAVHALEIAHAAKLNLGTTWGIGESSVPGPGVHRRTGVPPGMGFVAVAGPTPETTGVMKLNPSSERTRSENMAHFANAALDLMSHLQEK